MTESVSGCVKHTIILVLPLNAGSGCCRAKYHGRAASRAASQNCQKTLSGGRHCKLPTDIQKLPCSSCGSSRRADSKERHQEPLAVEGMLLSMSKVLEIGRCLKHGHCLTVPNCCRSAVPFEMRPFWTCKEVIFWRQAPPGASRLSSRH